MLQKKIRTLYAQVKNLENIAVQRFIGMVYWQRKSILKPRWKGVILL